MGWTADCTAHRTLPTQGRPPGVQAPKGEAQEASGVLSVPECVPGRGTELPGELRGTRPSGASACPRRGHLSGLWPGRAGGPLTRAAASASAACSSILLAELLGPLGCVHGAWLARHGALHDLPRTGRPAVLRAAPSPWMAGVGGSHWGLPLPGGNGVAASLDPKLMSVSSDTSPRAHWTPAPALLGELVVLEHLQVCGTPCSEDRPHGPL